MGDFLACHHAELEMMKLCVITELTKAKLGFWFFQSDNEPVGCNLEGDPVEPSGAYWMSPVAGPLCVEMMTRLYTKNEMLGLEGQTEE